MQPVKVGVIGCGAISGAYFENAKKFPILDIAACSDIDLARGKSSAEKFGIARACSVEDLLADESIEIVLNLTVPKAHVPVSLRAIAAGKHVYCEKPLGIDRTEGQKLIDAAKKAKLRVGCAPDTFLGAGVQTSRKLIEDGEIGRPVAFTAFMMCPGHESWHPSPAFYYEKGGGPMLDMGPYYLTALLNLLGPVKQLSGAASIAIPERTITSEPLRGTKIKVETPDHLAGTIEFMTGAIGTIVMSFATRFATYDSSQPITIYGTDGTMRVPDPNGFDGPVHVRKPGEKDWREIPPQFPAGYGRSIGLADMAIALRENRPHRASGEQAMAVLDLMQGFLDSAASGRVVKPTAPFHRCALMK